MKKNRYLKAMLVALTVFAVGCATTQRKTDPIKEPCALITQIHEYLQERAVVAKQSSLKNVYESAIKLNEFSRDRCKEGLCAAAYKVNLAALEYVRGNDDTDELQVLIKRTAEAIKHWDIPYVPAY